MDNITVTILKKATADNLKEVNHLLSGLSLTGTPPRPLTIALLHRLIGQKNTFLLIAKSPEKTNKKIIGFVTIYIVRIPSGVIATVEDLLVDESYRRQGVGRLLMEYAISLAEKKSARHISLRTSPQRIAANKFYERMGFHLMATNFFRINLPRKKL